MCYKLPYFSAEIHVLLHVLSNLLIEISEIFQYIKVEQIYAEEFKNFYWGFHKFVIF